MTGPPALDRLPEIRAWLDAAGDLFASEPGGRVATRSPGCMMQIGAGFVLERGARRPPVVHPVELLAESYRRADVEPTARTTDMEST